MADPREEIKFIFDILDGLGLRQAPPQLVLSCNAVTNYSSGRFTAWRTDDTQVEGSFERTITGGELPLIPMAGSRAATTKRTAKKASRKTAKKASKKTAKEGARKASKKVSKSRRRR